MKYEGFLHRLFLVPYAELAGQAVGREESAREVILGGTIPMNSKGVIGMIVRIRIR